MNNTIFGRQHIGNQFPQQLQAPKKDWNFASIIANQILQTHAQTLL
jgi:hypothetical protein